MIDNNFDNTTLSFGRRQGPTARSSSLGASVSSLEYTEIINALVQGGFASQSEGIRTVLFAFARSTRVRDAVALEREAA